jgi:nucleotide-binding universal stress UspA family protein
MSKTIIVGSDISDHSHQATKWAMSNLYREGDVIHLVHCFQPLQPAVGPHYSYMPSEEEQANWRKQQAHTLEEDMKVAKALNESVKFKAVLIAGDPRDEMVPYAEKNEASAIVVGSRGRGAFKRALLGSVSTHIVHHSPVPVVVVRPDLLEKKEADSS